MSHIYYPNGSNLTTIYIYQEIKMKGKCYVCLYKKKSNRKSRLFFCPLSTSFTPLSSYPINQLIRGGQLSMSLLP